MQAEKDYKYELEVEVADLNEDNLLKPYAYQRLFGQVAEQHLNRIEMNVETTMQSNLAWVLVAISIEIVKPVNGCMKLVANTWHSEKRGPFFRREVVFKDTNGEIVFHGSGFSVLIDVEKRTIYHKKELPFFISEPIREFTIEASPTNKTTVEYAKVDERQVYNSYIDCLGHVNNCRYGEFAYDVFTDEERMKLGSLKRLDIYFLSELRIRDIFSLHKAYQANCLLIRGYNETKADKAFEVILSFPGKN
ncbi:MAG: acyl-ACP thioesterase domain-containing protein [Clostridia bacterium]